jgi:predicted transcriptional regulator
MGINLISCNQNPEEDVRHKSNLEIIGRILQVVDDGDCSSKNQIMYKSFLSYAQTIRYLENLTDSEFIIYDMTSQTYKITDNGKGFLQIYKEIDDMMNLSHSSNIEQYEAWIEEEIEQRAALAKRIQAQAKNYSYNSNKKVEIR